MREKMYEKYERSRAIKDVINEMMNQEAEAILIVDNSIIIFYPLQQSGSHFTYDRKMLYYENI